LIFNYFSINYKIIETNYHIFILAQTSEGEVLLETTDPLGGFVSNESAIEAKITAYQSNALPSESTKTAYRFSSSLYNEVSLDQLVGLLHYNLAVDAYNHGEITNSVGHLEQASQFYYSKRTKEFSELLLLKVQRTVQKDKQQVIARIQRINQVAGNTIFATSKAF
jgi:hypothetical protein